MFQEEVKNTVNGYANKWVWSRYGDDDYLYVEIGKRLDEVFVVKPDGVYDPNGHWLTPTEAVAIFDKAIQNQAIYQTSLGATWVSEFRRLLAE